MTYKIGEKYTIKVFTEPEEMEYLGKVASCPYNNSKAQIIFDVWRLYRYGRPDIFATYNGKFFVRPDGNTVEGFSKSIGDAFRFEGQGYSLINIGGTKVSIDEFKRQAKEAGVEDSHIEQCIMRGGFGSRSSQKGQIKYCPSCKVIRQTSCCACGCGNCEKCGYRWTCRPVNTVGNNLIPLNSLAGLPVIFDYMKQEPIYAAGYAEMPAELPIELL